MQIDHNKVATIDFTMYGDDGVVLETSQGESPLEYLHGYGELPEGLEEELAGKGVGDEVDITLEPADAYGEYDEDLVEGVPRDQFEDLGEIEVGMRFEAETDDGLQSVEVVRLEDDEVIIDSNVPYAGKTVRFTVKVLDVRDATAEEIEHGHVHGPECEH